MGSLVLWALRGPGEKKETREMWAPQGPLALKEVRERRGLLETWD